MKAVVQFDIPIELYDVEKPTIIKTTQDWVAKYSKHSFETYCKKYGHEYILVTTPKVGYCHPTWERLDFWLDPSWFEKYDEILYVDTDVYALPTAPDIFEESARLDCFKRIPYWKADNPQDPSSILYEVKDRFKEIAFQPGVFLLNKTVAQATAEYIKQYKDERFPDDGVLVNYAIAKSTVEIQNINQKFNVKLLDTHLSMKALPVFFFHAFGYLKIHKPKEVKNFLKNIYGEL